MKWGLLRVEVKTLFMVFAGGRDDLDVFSN